MTSYQKDRKINGSAINAWNTLKYAEEQNKIDVFKEFCKNVVFKIYLTY